MEEDEPVQSVTISHNCVEYLLTIDQIEDIKRHCELAADTGGAVGNHWVLLAVIQKCGIPICNTVDVMQIGANLWMNF